MHYFQLQYYDWERNECVQYKWFGDENYFNQVESDTEIPANIDPSQTIYYPDLEPQLLMVRHTLILSTLAV